MIEQGFDPKAAAVINDLQQRLKLAEEALDKTSKAHTTEAADKYRLLAENSRDIIIFVSLEGKILEANRAAVEAYGYSREELQRLSLFDIGPDDQPELLRKQLETAVQSGILFETLHKRKDGSVFPVEVSAHGADIAGERVILSIVRDISSRKSANQEILQQTALIEGINRIFHRALTSKTKAKLGEACLDVAGELTNSLFGFIAEVDNYGDLCLFASRSGSKDGREPDFDLKSSTIFGRALNGASYFINDLSTTPKLAGPPSLASYLEVSLIRDREVIGIIGLANKEGGFSHKDVQIVEALVPAMVEAITSKRIEESLRESERVYRAIGESINYGIWICAPDGRNTYASESFLKLVGMTQQECSDYGWGNVLHPDDAERTIAAWKECVRTGGHWDIVHRYKGLDGKWHPILARGVPVRDDEGEITCWAGINLDLSELKATEDALRQSEEHYRLLHDTMLQGVVYQDTDGNILSMNNAAVEILGKTPEEFIGQTSESVEYGTIREDGTFFPGEQHPAMVALNTGKEVHDVTMGVYNPRERRFRWISISAVPLFKEGAQKPYQVYTIFSDCTERKRMEAELRSSRAKLETALESMSDAVIITDADGDFVNVNNAFATFHRFATKEEALKALTEPDLIQLCRPDGSLAPWDERPIRRALRGESTTDAEYTLKLNQTGETWVGSYSFAPIRNSEGTIVGSVVTARDVTEKKRAEEELRELAERLDSHMENSPMAVIEFDPDYRIIRWSDEARHIFGWSADEVFGKRIDELKWVYEEDWPIVNKLMEDMNAGIRVRNVSPNRNYRKDGAIIYCEWYNSVLKDANGQIKSVLSRVLDVTEREEAVRSLKELQAATAESLALLETIQEVAPAGMAFVDRGLRFVRINEEMAIINGFSIADHLGKRVDEILPSLWPQLEPIYQRVLAGEWVCNLEISGETQASPGELRHWVVSYYPVSVNEQTLGVGSIVFDITERKKMEEAIRDSEARFRSVFDSTSDAILIANDERRYVDANPAVKNVLGLVPEEVIGKSINEIVGGSYDHEAAWRNFVERGKGHAQIRITHRDGSQRIVEVNSVANIVPGRHMAVMRDMTERVRYERELQEARQESEEYAARLMSFIANMVDGATLYDNEGHLLIINEAGKQIFGVTSDDQLENWMAGFQWHTVSGEPIDKENTGPYRALRGETIADYRYKVTTPWGKTLVMSVTASPVRNQDGAIVGATTVFRDVERQVQYELQREELLKREQHIAHVLQEALVPPNLPVSIKGFEIGVKYQPALKEAEVGGDFYDVFPLQDGKLGVVIGDVAGKGLNAAIRVAAARYSVRSYAYVNPEPSFVMTLTNDALCRENLDESGMLTAFFGVIDTKNRTMTYTSAGHESPIVCRESGIIEELRVGGMPLGIIAGSTYSQETIQLEYDDTIVMVTDGITEARAPGVQLFEKQGLIDYVTEYADLHPQEKAEGILAAATKHAKGRLPDDAAIVVVKVHDVS